MRNMTHGSLFSGIGGFDLAAEWMGWDNLFHCEWNPFGQKVLHHYWPNAEQFTDITKSNFIKYANRIDVLTGGFPCQPYSVAGKRLGKEDERHLWPEMLRAIREIQPRYVVGENVAGLINWNGGLVFDEVQIDLENQGYEVIPFVLPACAVNAPHRRDRVWFVAYSDKFRQICGCEQRKSTEKDKYFQHNTEDVANDTSKRLEGRKRPRINTEYSRRDKQEWDKDWLEVASEFCRVDDGVPERLDKISLPKWRNESIKAYGNAIVPQVVHQIFQSIQQFENTLNA